MDEMDMVQTEEDQTRKCFYQLAFSALIVFFLIFIASVFLIFTGTSAPVSVPDVKLPSHRPEECRCSKASFADYFCGTDFVLLVKLWSEGAVEGETELTVYPYILENIIKKPNISLLKTKFRLFASNSGQCARRLEGHRTYLVAGNLVEGRLTVSSCDHVVEWDPIGPEARRSWLHHIKDSVDCAGEARNNAIRVQLKRLLKDNFLTFHSFHSRFHSHHKQFDKTSVSVDTKEIEVVAAVAKDGVKNETVSKKPLVAIESVAPVTSVLEVGAEVVIAASGNVTSAEGNKTRDEGSMNHALKRD